MVQFEGFFHSAKIMLSRFHFICSSKPLRLDWKKPGSAKIAKLTPHEVRLMEQTQTYIKENGEPITNSLVSIARMLIILEEKLRELRGKHKYEHDLYWFQQMFVEDWLSPRPTIEDEIE